MKAVNLTTGIEIADNVVSACSVLKRMKGLLGRKEMAVGEAMLIAPCKGIHTIGMRFAIDVLFLDSSRCVVGIRRRLLPNRITPVFRKAACVLELPAGALEVSPVDLGDQIAIV